MSTNLSAATVEICGLDAERVWTHKRMVVQGRGPQLSPEHTLRPPLFNVLTPSTVIQIIGTEEWWERCMQLTLWEAVEQFAQALLATFPDANVVLRAIYRPRLGQPLQNPTYVCDLGCERLYFRPTEGTKFEHIAPRLDVENEKLLQINRAMGLVL